MVKAQEWLEENYPKNGTCLRENEKNYGDDNINNYGKTREQITKLDISNQKLEGELDLSDFTNLEELDCFHIHLTQIFYPSNPEQLIRLDIRNNNLIEQDLTILSQFGNLRYLLIGN